MRVCEISGTSFLRCFPTPFLYGFLFFISISFAQNPLSYWVDLEDVDLQTKKITSSENFSRNGFYFEVKWDKNMGIMENRQDNYVGISSLKIYNWKKELINHFTTIKDEVGLGAITLSFYDFNLDGQIDFKLIRECGKSCYSSYFLFNNDLRRFKHEVAWNHVKIDKINKREKLLSLHRDDHLENKIYRLNKNTFIEAGNF